MRQLWKKAVSVAKAAVQKAKNFFELAEPQGEERYYPQPALQPTPKPMDYWAQFITIKEPEPIRIHTEPVEEEEVSHFYQTVKEWKQNNQEVDAYFARVYKQGKRIVV